MRNYCIMGIIGVALSMNGCASSSSNIVGTNNQVDLYLSTLDDKHFVWCKLDLEQCRTDFENWEITPRGRAIIKEYEEEQAGQTANTQYVPNVFRTHFANNGQFFEQDENILSEGIKKFPRVYGPEVSTNVETNMGSPEWP